MAPGYPSELARALHVGLMFALGCTAFTVVNVPYSSEERFGEIKQIIAGKILKISDHRPGFFVYA